MESVDRAAVFQNNSIPMGSRYAILETDEEESNVAELQTVQHRPQEMENITLNLQEQIEGSREKICDVRPVEYNNSSSKQNKSSHLGRQEANVKMLRSKSIMEHFVKAKNNEENKLSGSLKASGGGSFKHQKSTKTQV